MRPLVYRSPAGEGKTFAAWVDELRNRSGAYVIRSRRSGEVLYVGESHTGRLAKTIKRHFYRWRDSPGWLHHTYDVSAVEVGIRLTPPNAATGAQDNLIRRLRPSDNVLSQPSDPPF